LDKQGVIMKSFSKYLAEQDEFGTKYTGRKQMGVSMPVGGEIMKPGAPTGLLGMRRGQNVSDFRKVPTATRPTKYLTRPGETIAQQQTRASRRSDALRAAGGAASAGLLGATAAEISDTYHKPSMEYLEKFYPKEYEKIKRGPLGGRGFTTARAFETKFPPRSSYGTSEALGTGVGAAARGATFGAGSALGPAGQVLAALPAYKIKDPVAQSADKFFSDRGVRSFGTGDAGKKEREYLEKFAGNIDKAAEARLQQRWKDQGIELDQETPTTNFDMDDDEIDMSLFDD